MNVIGNIEFSIIKHTAHRVVGVMPVLPGILNPYGVAHAGAILWFADVCASLLVFGTAEVKVGATGFPLGINLNAAILGNQKGGTFTATSEFVKQGRTLSVVRTAIIGDHGRVIADITTSHVPSR